MTDWREDPHHDPHCAARPASHSARSRVQGIEAEVFGDANDMSAGLSGGTIVVRPPATAPIDAHSNVIIGNTVLYGATAGKPVRGGQAGERSRWQTRAPARLVEGCGLEWLRIHMTVLLPSPSSVPFRRQFRAGMTAAAPSSYAPDKVFANVINDDSVVLATRPKARIGENQLRGLVEEHQRLTSSKFAEGLLREWGRSCRSLANRPRT